MLRLAKLRDTQWRQAEAIYHQIQAALRATYDCATTLAQGRLAPGALQTAADLQHSDMLLAHLQQTAKNLTAKLATAQHDLRERARDAKQLQKVVEQQRAGEAAKLFKAEQQTVEAWLRSRPKIAEEII